MEAVERFRRLEQADLDSLVELDSQCFSRPWTRQQFADELSIAQGIVLGGFLDRKLVAAVCAREVVDELWIFRIMTHPQLRRRGLAHELLFRLDAFAHARTLPLDMWLEVNVHNASAIAFYERNGFRVQSVRKGYYPDEGVNGAAADALIMKRASIPWQLDYELLDFGEGFKLERFGNNIVMRPDVRAVGEPKRKIESWGFDASCVREGKDFSWNTKASFTAPWHITRGPLTFELRNSQSKNIGIFPEQESNWAWLSETISMSQRSLKVLNLFAYTGGATLVAAHLGSNLCHVDSARSTVQWASANSKRSGLAKSSIRWIVDDAKAFIEKELRRGSRYDGIILDPPPMGHGKSNRFEFHKDASDLIATCKKLLTERPTFFLLNTYAMNLSPKQIGALVEPLIGLPLETGELQIKEASGDRRLSCSAYVRYRRDD